MIGYTTLEVFKRSFDRQSEAMIVGGGGWWQSAWVQWFTVYTRFRWIRAPVNCGTTGWSAMCCYCAVSCRTLVRSTRNSARSCCTPGSVSFGSVACRSRWTFLWYRRSSTTPPSASGTSRACRTTSCPFRTASSSPRRPGTRCWLTRKVRDARGSSTARRSTTFRYACRLRFQCSELNYMINCAEVFPQLLNKSSLRCVWCFFCNMFAFWFVCSLLFYFIFSLFALPVSAMFAFILLFFYYFYLLFLFC